MVCYGCFAFFLLLGGLLGAMAGYYPLDTDHMVVLVVVVVAGGPGGGGRNGSIIPHPVSILSVSMYLNIYLSIYPSI
jgi:hypothetical protein